MKIKQCYHSWCRVDPTDKQIWLSKCVEQTWNNMRKQCLCKFSKSCVNFYNVPAYYIENAQKGLCKVKFAKFACARDKQYYMSELDSQTSN